MEYQFDVGVSSHAGLKTGIVVEYWTLVTVEADHFYEASLIACQMAFGHDQYVTTCLWKL